MTLPPIVRFLRNLEDSPENLVFSDILFMAIFAEVTENECIIISEVLYCGSQLVIIYLFIYYRNHTQWYTKRERLVFWSVYVAVITMQYGIL